MPTAMVSVSSTTQGIRSTRPARPNRQPATDVTSTIIPNDNSLKRKLEQFGSEQANKKHITQTIANQNTNSSILNSRSTTSAPTSSRSEPSLNTFHRSVFQSYVKTALDDLDNKVCNVDYCCSGIYKTSGKNGRKKLMRKQEERFPLF